MCNADGRCLADELAEQLYLFDQHRLKDKYPPHEIRVWSALTETDKLNYIPFAKDLMRIFDIRRNKGK